MPKFQLMSDIHLEFLDGDFPDIEPAAPNLILAGDICLLFKNAIFWSLLYLTFLGNLTMLYMYREYYSGRKYCKFWYHNNYTYKRFHKQKYYPYINEERIVYTSHNFSGYCGTRNCTFV